MGTEGVTIGDRRGNNWGQRKRKKIAMDATTMRHTGFYPKSYKYFRYISTLAGRGGTLTEPPLLFYYACKRKVLRS